MVLENTVWGINFVPMSNLIQLLPDHVANQIAAGEVIQRPASVIKELVENAIDAGATEITVVVKDAGRTLIQVIDNGCGMSEVDARMSFERHATSKIRSSDDIFKILTKGFRGEALASIAAIAQVELKTRRGEDALGQHLTVEGSEVKNQQPIACPAGTQFLVKHLFYNTPARRNFLKSDAVEIKHITEEFLRVAFVHADVGFRLFSNENELFHLPAGNARQRIVQIMGKSFNEKLVPVEQDTSLVRVSGFVVKPEFAKKTRGEQYLFVNQRFIKSNYLHHAIASAFDDLIDKGSYPSYFIYLDLDPASIDINIHPTKTEIKFQDERSLYAIIAAAVKQSLGLYNIKPSLDFDHPTHFELPIAPKGYVPALPQSRVNPDYNPFKTGSSSGSAAFIAPQQPGRAAAQWEELLRVQQEFDVPLQAEAKQLETAMAQGSHQQVDWNRVKTFQLYNCYIIADLQGEMYLIDQKRAHERVLYERFLALLKEQKPLVQTQLFPEAVELSPQDYAMVLEWAPALAGAGLAIENFGQNTLVVNGMPAFSRENNPKVFIETLIEQMKHHRAIPDMGLSERMALSLARSSGIRRKEHLSKEERMALVRDLFECNNPWYTARGKTILTVLKEEELTKKLS